jgi:hypothetical protein
VTVDPASVSAVLTVLRETGQEVTDEEVEAVRVQTSPEYRTLSAEVKKQHRVMGKQVCINLLFWLLVAFKLEDTITASWWVVFLPVWIVLGVPWAVNFLTCCCSASPPQHMDEEMLGMNVDDDCDDRKDGEEKDDKEHSDDEKKEEGGNAKTSTNFASVEGSMDEFNRSIKDPSESGKGSLSHPSDEFGDPVPVTEARTSNVESTIPEDEEVLYPEDEGEVYVPAKPDPPVDTAYSFGPGSIKPDSVKPDPPAQLPAGVEVDVEKGVVDDDDEEMRREQAEEEFFRAWQARMMEEEQDDAEKRAKAMAGCCWSSLQITIMCLIVGLLEAEYEGGDGYNAFWILFPIFLIAGLLLCCCSLMIYGKAPDLSAHEKHQEDGKGDEVAEGQQEGEPIVIPPASTTASSPPQETSSREEEADVEKGEGATAAEETATATTGAAEEEKGEVASTAADPDASPGKDDPPEETERLDLDDLD